MQGEQAIRREEPVEIQLLPVEGEEQLQSAGFQRELREFFDALRAEGINFSPQQEIWNASAAVGFLSAFFTGEVTLSVVSAAVVTRIMVAWLRSRPNAA